MMQISSSAYLGVETMVRLAMQKTEHACTTQDLAEWLNRSVSYTEGLMAKLRKAGLVASRDGPGNGHMLARPAHRITVADVFRAIDAPSRFANKSDLQDIYDLHGTDLLWGALEAYVLLILKGVSLADIALDAPGLTGEADDEALTYLFDVQSIVYH